MHPLRDFHFCAQLSDEKFAKLEKISRIVHYKKGTIAFFEGEKPTSLFVLTEGILQVYKTDMKGNKVVIHRFYPKEMVAELTNFEHINLPASAEFETDGSAVLIEYAKFESEFLSDPQVSLAFIKSLTKKIKYLEDVIANNLTMSSTARVSKFLCEQQEEIAKMKKNIIAAKLNITPETLSRILKKLTDLHLISKDKEFIKVLNKKKLASLYE